MTRVPTCSKASKACWHVGGRIPIVADAAHALGAEYKGRPIATVGHAVIFSFQAIKHLTTGDGGALALNSSPGYECEVETVVKGVDAQVVATRARKLRWFGLDRNYTGGSKWEQDIPECGFKFHANNIAAAIGHAQLDHIDTILWRHRQNSARYDKEITNPRVEKLRRPSNVVSSAWVYSLLVEDPKGFQAHMQGKGIASDVVHMRCDRYSVFKDFAVPAGSLPGLDHFGSRLMNVPVGWWLSEDDASRVIDAVNAWRP